MGILNIAKLNTIFQKLDVSRDDFPIFVETGTYMGNSLKEVSPYFTEKHSIELSEKYYRYSSQLFSKDSSIFLYEGESCDQLLNLLSKIKDNVLFWLDAHYSSGDTALGIKSVPLIDECKIINSNSLFESSIVLIDDIRLFGTNRNSEDWSNVSIDSIVNCFTNFEVNFYEDLKEDYLCVYIKRKT